MFGSLLAVVSLLFAGAYAATQQLQQVTNFGPNPNNVGMFVYRPAQLAHPTPLIVAIHYCTGTAQAYFSGTQYANLADTHGFIVIYPNSPRSGTCFDVNTNQTLTHNGGGDSQGIASMVTYAIANYGVDATQVFVTGTSSGAMMTNVMAGAYPNLFKAASLYSGVPFACFAGPNSWNSQCADGDLIQTPQQWGQLVFNAYPGYTGARPKMMIWHGTADQTLFYPNYGEEIKQWTDVFGLSQTPTTSAQNNPQSGYTMTTYGTEVVGYSAAGVGHTVPVHEANDLAWFGIANITPGTGTGTATGTRTATGTGTAPTGTGAVAQHWDQCSGISWTGATVCAAPFTCQTANAYPMPVNTLSRTSWDLAA